MTAHADDLERVVDRLIQLRSDASPRQQRAIYAIVPMLRDVAVQVRSLSTMSSKNVDRSDPPLFRDCTIRASDTESRTAAMIEGFLRQP